MEKKYDALIVGAGFSGAVLAERMASQLGWRVLVLEQRSHIGGNCYDECDEHGILVHRYGPHIFHTDNQNVWDYLSQFTEWRAYEHKVLGSIDSQLVPLPFNLNSIHQLFPREKASAIESALIERFGEGARVPILTLRQAQEPVLVELAAYVYEKVFKNYTAKQWGCQPEDIASEVTARVPVVVSRKDGYFTDNLQGVPAEGYTALFERMLAHRNIEVRLETPFSTIAGFNASSGEVTFEGQPFGGILIFTGMIDELFDFRYGELPYRSLRFEFRHCPQQAFQQTAVVNYPNAHDYTRITEFKHLTGQTCADTTVVYEYPQGYDRDVPAANIPYYPLFTTQGDDSYRRYGEAVQTHPQLMAVGRLAQYRYLDMDDAVENALRVFDHVYAEFAR